MLKKSAASGRSSRHEWVLRLDRFQSAIEVLVKFNANASRMAISSITLGELMHGAEKPGFNGHTRKPALVDKYGHFHKM